MTLDKIDDLRQSKITPWKAYNTIGKNWPATGPETEEEFEKRTANQQYEVAKKGGFVGSFKDFLNKGYLKEGVGLFGQIKDLFGGGNSGYTAPAHVADDKFSFLGIGAWGWAGIGAGVVAIGVGVWYFNKKS